MNRNEKPSLAPFAHSTLTEKRAWPLLSTVKSFALILSFAGLLLGATDANALACTSAVAIGNWGVAGTWTSAGNCNRVPTAADTVTIATGHTITVNAATANVLSVTVNTGAILTQTQALSTAGVLSVAGTLTSNNAVTVTGATTVTGNLNTVGAGARTYTGLVTVNAGGIWNNSGNRAVTFRGGITNNGTFTAGTGTQTFNLTQAIGGANPINFGGIVAVANGVTVTNNNISVVTITGNLTGGNATSIWVNAANSTLNYGGAAAPMGTRVFTASAVPNTVNYNGAAAQAVKTANYNNLTVTKAAGIVATTAAGTVNVTGTLTVTSGTLNIAGTTIAVTGATNVSGTLGITSATGTKTFAGAVTVNPGGTWTNTTEAVTFRGGLTHNGATFTAGTGVHTFDITAAQAINCATALSIPSVTVIAPTVLTNNCNLTVSTALAGTGTLTNAATGILNIGGTSLITTLNATAVGNTVNYTGAAAQTVKATAYSNLGLGGGGIKTITGVTVANNLTLSGTATASPPAAFTVGGNLDVGVGSTFTSANFTNSVTGTTTVSGTLAHSGVAAKTYIGAVTINAGGIWTNAGNAPITFRGGLTHNGATFTAGTGIYTFNTTAAQSVNCAVALTIPSVTVTTPTVLTNNCNLTVSTALAGTGNLTNSATGTLNIGGTSLITTLNASTAGNTVNYTGAAQTVKATTYHHLGLGGSGAKAIGATTINGNFTMSGTATTAPTGALTVGGSFSIGAGNTFANGANALNVAGNFAQDGIFTAGAGVVTLNGGAAVQTISGTGPLGFANLTVSNAGITLARNVTVTSAIIGAVTLTSTCPTDYTLTSNGGATVAHSCPSPPTATTNAATALTASGATLNGTVSSNGTITTVTFDYGLTAGYGSSATATQSPLAADTVNAAVSADLIGLNCNTTFHYRVKATNNAGTTNGLDSTFTTLACGAPYPATACAATRFNNDLGCTANDVSISSISIAPTTTRTSCVSGTPVTLDLDLTVNFASPDRWDIGIFIANDGKLPTLLPVNGGASSCSVDVLPTPVFSIPPPVRVPPISFYGDLFLDLDGVPQGTTDKCGDGNSSYTPTTVGTPVGSGIKRMYDVTLPCYASATSGGQLFVPFVVSWDNQKSPTGSICTSNLDPVPNTTSKCNAPASSVSVAVVVLPVITKTNGGNKINPGANTTYTVVINNNSGGTLLDMVFTDPVVTNLSVNSMSCAAAGGSTCPAMTSAAMIAAMQPPPLGAGAGIPIPSASLPNNSTLTFTINATVSPGAGIGSHIINTATVTLTGGSSTSDSDDDTVVLAPSAAKSFSPGTITEGASSVLTVTLTNPTASPVTAVSFTDTYPAGLVNTPSAGGATTCGGTVTAANNGTSLALSGAAEIPASGSCTVTVNVTSATAGSYNNNTGTVTHASGTIPAASATLTVNAAVGGSFVFTDAVCQHNIAFGGVGQTCSQVTWPAQTAGVNATAVYITAVNASNVPTRLHASQARTRDMEFGLSCHDPIANAGVQATFAPATLPLCEASGATPTTWSSPVTTVTFPGGSPSSSVSYTFNYADVGWVELWMRNSAIPTDTGHSNVFVVKPAGFVLSNIKCTTVDAANCGAGALAMPTPGDNPGAVNAAGVTFIRAGHPFSVTVTATAFGGAPTRNYGKEITPEGVRFVDTSLPPANPNYANHGTLAAGLGLTINQAVGGTFGAFANGAATGTAFTWNEAGIITLTPSVADANYLSAGDVIGTTSGNVGRFYAAKFTLIPSPIANRTDICPAPAGCSDAFTYMGEQMSAVFNLTAKAVDGTTTLQNYSTANSFAKLDPLAAITVGTGGPLVMGAVDSAATRTPFPPCGVIPAHPCLTPAQATAGTFASGEASVTVPFTLYRDNAIASGPFSALDVAVAPQDSDGAIMAAYDRDTVNVVAGANNHTLVGQTIARYGRLKLSNAYGSELLPLTLTATAQYYTAAGNWITNSDSSTQLVLPASYSVGTGTTTVTLSPTTGILSSGTLNINLGAPSVTGKVTVTPTFIPPTASTYLPLTFGQATFGVYRGRNEFIYMRENY